MHQNDYILPTTKLCKINATRDKPLVIEESLVLYRCLFLRLGGFNEVLFHSRMCDKN